VSGSRTILVTGAAGFIGAAVSEKLLARGDAVIGVDNLSDYYDVSLKQARLKRLETKPGFSFHRMDIADRDAVNGLADQAISHILHLAAQAGVRHSLVDPYAYVTANVMGPVVLWEMARKLKDLKHFVYASSSYAHLYGIPATGLRFFTVYGPWGRPDMAPFIFADAIARQKPLFLNNNGEMWRDFTYIDDIVDGVLRALDRPATGAPPHKLYNLGNHKSEKLTDFLAEIERALQKKAIIEPRPMPAGDVLKTYADIEASTRDLGFAPTTPISVGIPKFIAWYRDFYGA
jgi:UDP-glucuronate 4-epimerase